MVQSPSWAANWFAASQEIPRISRNPKVHHQTHKRPPPVSILGQPNPVHIPTSHFLEIRPNIIHPPTHRSPCSFGATVAKHKYNFGSKFNAQTTGIIFILYSKYTVCSDIKYAGLRAMFPLFMQRVRKGPSLGIGMPSHASLLAPTTHNAGYTRAEYQCPLFCLLTAIHERFLYIRSRKF